MSKRTDENTTTCQASVHRPFSDSTECSRKAWRDGYCKQHHPDTVAAKKKASDEKFAADWAASRAHHARAALVDQLVDGADDDTIRRAVAMGGLVAVMRRAEGDRVVFDREGE